MALHPTGLLAQRSFALIWTGQTVSQLGSQVTLVALPLTAILVLGATPLQVGLLTATGFASAALFGLFAGVWVDRVRRRRLLIAAQLVLAVTTGSVPAAGWLGLLRLEHLFVLEAINGALTVLSTAAAQAYLPTLVGTEQLTDANAKLATSGSVTRIAGPGLGGGLVQALGAPLAILADALSFLVSAVCLMLIRAPEPPTTSAGKRGLRGEIQEGLYLLLGHRLIRPLVLSTGAYNFFAAMFVAVYTLFMVRDLGLDPAAVGSIIASGGLGGVLGGLAAGPVARRFGAGRAIVGGAILLALMHVAAPVAGGPPMATVPLLAGAGLLAQLGLGVHIVNRTSLVQQLVPAHALGRVAASQQVIGLAAVPIGAALGGLIGEGPGPRASLAIAALGTIGATVTLLRSPLWTSSQLAEMPEADVPRESGPGEPPARSPAILWRFTRTEAAPSSCPGL
jgi:MFS family permease